MKVDLAALVELEKRATPGEWVVLQNPTTGYTGGIDSGPHDGKRIVRWGGIARGASPSGAANAQLIAALRNAAPALLAVAQAAVEWREAYLADDECDERPFITRLDTAGGNLCDAVRALVEEVDDSRS